MAITRALGLGLLLVSLSVLLVACQSGSGGDDWNASYWHRREGRVDAVDWKTLKAMHQVLAERKYVVVKQSLDGDRTIDMFEQQKDRGWLHVITPAGQRIHIIYGAGNAFVTSMTMAWDGDDAPPNQLFDDIQERVRTMP